MSLVVGETGEDADLGFTKNYGRTSVFGYNTKTSLWEPVAPTYMELENLVISEPLIYIHRAL